MFKLPLSLSFSLKTNVNRIVFFSSLSFRTWTTFITEESVGYFVEFPPKEEFSIWGSAQKYGQSLERNSSLSQAYVNGGAGWGIFCYCCCYDCYDDDLRIERNAHRQTDKQKAAWLDQTKRRLPDGNRMNLLNCRHGHRERGHRSAIDYMNLIFVSQATRNKKNST